jgi:hypothetical protein
MGRIVGIKRKSGMEVFKQFANHCGYIQVSKNVRLCRSARKQLSPNKLQLLLLGQVLLHGIVNPLNGHVREICPIQNVGHCGAEPEWVDGPVIPGNIVFDGNTFLR